jgi:hypothetical protein
MRIRIRDLFDPGSLDPGWKKLRLSWIRNTDRSIKIKNYLTDFNILHYFFS